LRRDSDTRSDKRFVWGSRQVLRNVLWRGDVSATRSAQGSNLSTDRLKAAPKLRQQNIFAIVRKLFVLTHILRTDGRTWKVRSI
jgi:hypothetical protein